MNGAGGVLGEPERSAQPFSPSFYRSPHSRVSQIAFPLRAGPAMGLPHFSSFQPPLGHLGFGGGGRHRASCLHGWGPSAGHSPLRGGMQ